jgi:hypothetical protein
MVRKDRARRYALRLRPDGAARVTGPRGGSVSEARRFADHNLAWLGEQLRHLAFDPPTTQGVEVGSRSAVSRRIGAVGGRSERRESDPLWFTEGSWDRSVTPLREQTRGEQAHDKATVL